VKSWCEEIHGVKNATVKGLRRPPPTRAAHAPPSPAIRRDEMGARLAWPTHILGRGLGEPPDAAHPPGLARTGDRGVRGRFRLLGRPCHDRRARPLDEDDADTTKPSLQDASSQSKPRYTTVTTSQVMLFIGHVRARLLHTSPEQMRARTPPSSTLYMTSLDGECQTARTCTIDGTVTKHR
jgi:hypothetical protein